jgi:hypothetical protein
MMAAEIRATGDSLMHGTPQVLFDMPYATEGNTLSRYAVSADGKRFVMAAEPDVSSEAPPLHMIVNWLAGVKK